MSTVIECIKCFCGCNELSKDRLKEIISKDIHSFLNDQPAVDMFKKFIPKDSRTHKQLDIIEQAKEYRDKEDDISAEEWEEFAEELHEHLEDELKNADTKAATVLDKVIFEYSKNVEESKDFENFSSNLREKYRRGFSRN